MTQGGKLLKAPILKRTDSKIKSNLYNYTADRWQSLSWNNGCWDILCSFLCIKLHKRAHKEPPSSPQHVTGFLCFPDLHSFWRECIGARAIFSTLWHFEIFMPPCPFTLISKLCLLTFPVIPFSVERTWAVSRLWLKNNEGSLKVSTSEL